MTRLAKKLKHWVKLQKVTQTHETGGKLKRTYTTLKKLPVQIQELRGREMILARETGSGETVRITMRYDPDVKKNLFLRTIDERHPERVFKITSAQPMNDYEYFEVLAQEIEEEA
jgi:SPP1 family predicted phage head-tail adaptor